MNFTGTQGPSHYRHSTDPEITVEVTKVLTMEKWVYEIVYKRLDYPEITVEVTKVLTMEKGVYEIVYKRLDYPGAPYVHVPKETFDKLFIRIAP